MVEDIGYKSVTFARVFPEIFKFEISPFSEDMITTIEDTIDNYVQPSLAYCNYKKYKTREPWYSIYEVHENYGKDLVLK
jgi:hypothetical protein